MSALRHAARAKQLAAPPRAAVPACRALLHASAARRADAPLTPPPASGSSTPSPPPGPPPTVASPTSRPLPPTAGAPEPPKPVPSTFSSSSSSSSSSFFGGSVRQTPPNPLRPVGTLLKWLLYGTVGTFGLAYYLDSRAAIHRWVAIPVLQATADPETAQKLAVQGLASGIMPRDMGVDDEVLQTQLFGKTLSNPIGLAAGFDKQGEAIDGLLGLGFGIVEIGSVTPEPQPGNDLPRYFRLDQDRAAINRFGFNSDGHDAVLARLQARIDAWLHSSGALNDVRVPISSSNRASEVLAANPAVGPLLLDAAELPRSARAGQFLSVNLGKNKTSPADSVDDYVKGVQKLGPYADMLVINISSPNTAGLRNLQRKEALQRLLKSVVDARNELPKPQAPLLVKIAPDLSEGELNDIADAALGAKVDGLIVSNTTISRPASLLSPPHVTKETGGLSGPPVKPLAIKALQTIYKRVGDKMPLIGCGGIASGRDALDFAKAGATAVQLYTSFGYEGVGHPRRIKDELAAALKEEGTTWQRSIGKGSPQTEPQLPDGELPRARAGDASQHFDLAVASVKGEIEGLRNALGSHPRATAAPAFRSGADDSLVERVTSALGTEAPSRGGKTAPQAPVAGDEGLTRGEQLERELLRALHDPARHAGVPAPQDVSGSGAPVEPRGATRAAAKDAHASESSKSGSSWFGGAKKEAARAEDRLGDVTSRAQNAARDAYDSAASAGRHAEDKARGAARGASDAAASTGERVQESLASLAQGSRDVGQRTAESARDTGRSAQHAGRQALDGVEHAGRRALDGAEHAGERVQDSLSSLAHGSRDAARRVEEETSERARATARSAQRAGRQALDGVEHAGEQTYDLASRGAAAVADTARAGADEASHAASSLTRKASDAGHSVYDSADRAAHAASRKASDAGHSVYDGADRAAHAASREASHLASSISRGASRATDAVADTAHAGADEASRAALSLKRKASDAGHSVYDGADRAAHAASREASHLASSISHGASEASRTASAAGQSVYDGADRAAHAVSREASHLTSSISHGASRASEEASRTASAAGDKLSDAASRVSDEAAAARNALSRTASDASSKASDLTASTFHTIAHAPDPLVRAASSASSSISSAASSASSSISSAASSVEANVSGAAQSAKESLLGAQEKTKHAAEEAADMLKGEQREKPLAWKVADARRNV